MVMTMIDRRGTTAGGAVPQTKVARQRAFAKMVASGVYQLGKLTLVGVNHPKALVLAFSLIRRGHGRVLNYGSQCMSTMTEDGAQLMHNAVVYFDGTASEVDQIISQLSQLEGRGTTKVCTIGVANLMIAEVETIDLPQAFVQATTYLAGRGVDLVDVHGCLKRDANDRQQRSMTMLLEAPVGLTDTALEAGLKAECLPSSTLVQVRSISKVATMPERMLMESTHAQAPLASKPLVVSNNTPLLRLTVTGRNRCGMLAEALRVLKESQAETLSFHGDRAGYEESEGHAPGRVSVLFECEDHEGLVQSLKKLASLGLVRLEKYRVEEPVVLNFDSRGVTPFAAMQRLLLTQKFEILNVVGDWSFNRSGTAASHSINLVVARTLGQLLV